MELGKRQKQAARTKAPAKRIGLPHRPLDFQMIKKPRCQIGYQVAAGSSLHQNSRQIRADIVIDKMCAGLEFKRDCKRHFHPVILLIKRPLLPHQVSLLLSKAHRKQIPHRCLLQILIHHIRQILPESICQLLIQRQQPFLNRKANRARGKALCRRIYIPTAFRLIVPFPDELIILCDLDSKNMKPFRSFCKTS